MPDYNHVKLKYVAFAFAVLLSTATQADTLTGRVVGVSDGDTITILIDKEEVIIRLEGIDAPETGQVFGAQAKKLGLVIRTGPVPVLVWRD